MWFKNLQLHRFSAPWTLGADEIEQFLARHAFYPGTSLEMQTQGWAPVRDNGPLAHCVGKQILLTMRAEKKLLPTTVVNQVTKARAAEIEEQQGFKPGRKQMKELKEQITEELLPRAFSIRRDTRVWIDPVGGWLAIDAASPAKADEVRTLLFKALDPLPLINLHVNQSPVAAMTDWLSSDTAPAGFTVDQEIELQASAESKATVRYVRHPLEPEELRRHIAAGKRCTRLAMTWNDRVSFVLTDSLAVKRVAPLDVLKEQNDGTARDDDERFDADFTLMAGELSKMLDDLTEALGGERKV
ncbi:recombination-associated protein RdgC [Cupriavidus respiraculi]|uniref:Recombination-associated protein RdgC n=1 Tax=Cupriavidus respiraculi TaxID=195930 RepID=A0ABM8X9L7_9BURK|nr:recombination-associated protein RdgC [Cupriavidus respiraculi]CAG9176705.1 Recombination-associated protein RdgC [Cupriavidus respiraculi]